MSEHPVDCPSWEYKGHPQQATIAGGVALILAALAARKMETLALAIDTREAHRRMFREVTPAGCDYYAGHYRGERFRCLKFCSVTIPTDPRVGAPPELVDFRLRELNAEIRAGIKALDANVLLGDQQRLRYVLALACRAFVAFLTVHPYANGNGHAGRLIAWCITGRYGHWPRRWPVDPRPPDPPYSQLIVDCRNGNPEPLEMYLLQALIG